MGGCNSTLQAAWYVRHAHWARLCYFPFETYLVWCLCIISTIIWLLMLSSTSFMAGRSRVLYGIPHEKYRSVTPLGATTVNRTILRGRCGPQPFCARILYNPHRGRRKICMIPLHVKQNQQNSAKTVIHTPGI